MAEKSKSNKLVVIVIILLVLLLAAAGVVVVLLAKGDENTSSLDYTSTDGIGYEINAVVITSGDVAVSQPEGVGIRFNTAARSSDGWTFTCEIGNSTANQKDIYIDIYWDDSFEDELYLSGLMRPGQGITSFKTNRQIPSGVHEVVLVPTLVEDDHKTLIGQSAVVLTLFVD